MEKYKFIDNITSDVTFEAYGRNLKELFVNAAEAMFSVICKIKQVNSDKDIVVEADADNLDDLMVNWLQALLARVDIDEMFFSKFLILEITNTHLKAVISGESTSQEKGGTVVKAVTYYQYKFEKTKKGYKVRISLDI